MTRSKLIVPAAAAALLLAGAALAQGLSGAEAAQDRALHFKAMGKASHAIADQLKSGAPDMAAIKAQTAIIDQAAHGLPTWFPDGSGQAAWPKSQALPAIWADKAGFAEKAKVFRSVADTLDAAAQAGNAAGIGPAFHDLGQGCQSCHETYRAKDPA